MWSNSSSAQFQPSKLRGGCLGGEQAFSPDEVCLTESVLRSVSYEANKQEGFLLALFFKKRIKQGMPQYPALIYSQSKPGRHLYTRY